MELLLFSLLLSFASAVAPACQALRASKSYIFFKAHWEGSLFPEAPQDCFSQR